MGISETKKRIVLNNYFEKECNINTTIREAYEKGFELGLQKAPNSQEMSKWIPVRKRLPERADSYLVTYLTESGVYAGLVEFVESAYWTGLRWQKDCDDLKDVIAWMPLPEPYREVNE